MKLIVEDVERILLRVPFRPRPRPWNELLVGQWSVVEVCRVTAAAADLVGYGETPLGYVWMPWQVVGDASVERAVGRNVFELLGDDTLGIGLQMALYDLAGKALDVPAHRLFAQPYVRDQVPLAWWSTKMPPEVLAGEAADAAAAGYRSHKVKARPWFDVYEQVNAVSAVTPPDYRIELDWNEMLLHPAAAAEVIRELDENERISLYEDPVKRTDAAGQRFLRDRARRPLATHFTREAFPDRLRLDAVDGFVVDVGGIGNALHDGLLCAGFEKEFFLQTVGTGLTTALLLHLAAVLTHARWPAVSAMNVFADDLLVDPIPVTAGYAAVPDRPGLGVQVDEDALVRLTEGAARVLEFPRRLLVFEVPGGPTRTYAGTLQLWTDCRYSGSMPRQARGAHLRVVTDDGSDDFDRDYRAAERGPGGPGRPLA